MTRRAITVTTDHPNWYPDWRRSRTALTAGALAVLLGSALLADCARAAGAGGRDSTAAQPAAGGTASPTAQHAAGHPAGSASALTLDGTRASVLAGPSWLSREQASSWQVNSGVRPPEV